ncbi:MAG: hypothetical protein IKH43_05035 [Bacteroidaceae bacterium]|nr:hypothetical protein [Bacteroidaceae bacterium]
MKRKYILLLIGCWLLTVSFASVHGEPVESVPDKKPEKVLPVQEKVYLHFDNNCYFLGDTIWYKAYVVLADDNSPEPLSRILYVELLNEQGYLMERQQLQINKSGQADGCFAISDTTFAGFYEVRAYTKWMLNFGYEPCESWCHPSWLEFDEDQGLCAWNLPKDEPAIIPMMWYAGAGTYEITITGNVLYGMEYAGPKNGTIIEDTEYESGYSVDADNERKNYRDYHNLFSRVLPIYSRPDTASNYMRKVMPTKITVGDYEESWKTPEFDVKFYPEGGYLLAGHKCRVAWEAMNQQLERLNVSGVLLEDGEPIDSVRPVHAGRGLITLNVKHGRKYKVRFEFGKEKFTFDLPKPLEQGVALHVSQDSDAVRISVRRELPKNLPLVLNVYCRGKQLFTKPPFKGDLEGPVEVFPEDLNEGVHQVVVCDTSGNVYADRLFFVNKCYESKAKVMVGGIANRPYRPLEKIRLNLIATDPKGHPLKNQTFSVSVRDEAQLDPTFATGNIMTSLLLESDLKGFVENPDYYFEADDEKHRLALDVLMLVQGWRRYDWKSIEKPESFALDYLPEQKMVIYGDTYPLRKELKDLFRKEKRKIQVSCSLLNLNDDLKEGDYYSFKGAVEADSLGRFQIAYDPFYGNVRLALRANFVDKIEKKDEYLQTHDPKIFVRKQYFYPQSLKAYSWYETHQPEIIKEKQLTWEDYQEDIYASEWIPQVNIKSKRRPHAKLQKDKPVAQLNFLDFLNEKWDQGYYNSFFLMDNKEIPLTDTTGMSYLMLMDAYVRHMYKPSENNHESHDFSINWNKNNIWERIKLIEHIPILDRIYIVSDAPRRPVPYEHVHQDRVMDKGIGAITTGIDSYINIITLPDDKTRIMVGREYNFQGFTRPVEYYNPDYSKAKLPEIKDYRRTLYWNPNVTTDNFGQASIEFYNNSVCNIIDVSAEGITRYGQFLVNE